MLRSLYLSTALVGLAGTAMAQGTYVDTTGYTPHTGTYGTAIDGTVTLGEQPLIGTTYGTVPMETMPMHSAPITTGGQYTVAPSTAITMPASGHQTITATPGTSQTFTIPSGQNATYNIVVPSTAPAVVQQAQPTYAPVQQVAPALGWKARGVYVGARAGVTATRDTQFNLGRRPGEAGTEIRNEYDDPSYTGSLVAGYGARSTEGWGYRVEVEGGYQTAEIDAHELIGVARATGPDALGDANVLYGFVNVYGDVELTDRLGLTAGGGVGLGHIEFDKYGIRGGDPVLDDSATAFGYHLDAGVTYQLTDKVALEAMYRYQEFLGANVRTEAGNEDDIDLESHSILAGVRVGL